MIKKLTEPWNGAQYFALIAITILSTAVWIAVNITGTELFRVEGTVENLHNSSDKAAARTCKVAISTQLGSVDDDIDGDCPETLGIADLVSIQVRQERITRRLRPVHGTLLKVYRGSMFK